jgi:hypothetical protein
MSDSSLGRCNAEVLSRAGCYNDFQVCDTEFTSSRMKTGSSWLPARRCPAACVSQGISRSEARQNIQEAISLYLKSLHKHGEPIPPGIEEEVVEVTG